MLRPYKLPKSNIFKVQSFVNYIVIDILCKPTIANEFSSNLVLPKYKGLVEVNSNYILNPISEIFKFCKKIPKKELNLLKKAVLHNNRIRQLCNGEIKPVLYSELKFTTLTDIENIQFQKYIKSFCTYLYEECLDLASFYNIYGKTEDYYNSLVGRSLTCRCCGLNNVLGIHHTHRSALDHFFPKGNYPFSSVNFKNLVPICDPCNSKYKLSQNPYLRIEKGVRKKKKIEKTVEVKSFYPFRRDTPKIEINIDLKSNYSSIIQPKDIDISITCLGFEEQSETWERLFGIKENYKAECCSDEMFSFIEEEYIALINNGLSHDFYVSLRQNNIWGDKNVIKVPFLKALNVQIGT
jgi:5-methylcytosine-specific restriction endonuclease McrA